MSKRGFHQIGEAFSREIHANQNPVAINSPPEGFLQAWWVKFYEAFSSRFPRVPVFAAESFDKVAQTLENVVANNGPTNQSYASDHTGANISNVMSVMPSPHLMASSPLLESSGPDLMDAKFSDLLSSFDTGYVLQDLSGLQFPGYQMQQMPNVPPEWNARDDRPGINLGGPTLMEPNIHAPANALPASSELSDAGNNRSLQQVSHQGWPSVVGKEKATVAGIAKDSTKSYFSQGDAGLVSASNSIYALTKRAEWKDISFKEIRNLHATNSKLLCCHFNSQGELLATAGHDRKVLIWELRNNNVNSGEGHTHHVTDVRFRPNSTVFATSSFDRTVKIWDAAKPSNPFQNLVGHAEHVMSIDFHPTKVGLLSSCDSNDEIRLWDVNRGDCKLIFEGGSRQVRFQPQLGDFLASSTKNIINIFDVETNSIQKKLQGHVKDVRSICWDMSGNYLASVSEDSARIWSVSEGKCIFELFSSGNKFQSCTFHPGYAQVLVIGSSEFLELWNPIFQSNITWPYSAHAGIISSLADSPSKGIIASVSHDQWIKIWQ